MKNPYAKPAAKRPRLEERNVAEFAQTDTTSDAFWDEAFKVLENETLTQRQRANCDLSSPSVENRSGAAQFSLSYSLPASQPNASVGAAQNAVKQSMSSQTSLNPYQTSNKNTTKLSYDNGHDRKLEDDAQQKPPPVDTREKVSSVNIASNSVNTNAADTSSGPPIAKSSFHVVSASNSIYASVVAPVERASSEAEPSLAHRQAKVPRPSTWRTTSEAASTVSTETTTSRPSSSSGMDLKPSAKVASHQSMKPAALPSVPRPAAWDNNNANSTTASMPEQPGSRPSSSHGLPPQQNKGLPPPLNYAPERAQPLNDEYRPLLVKNANLSAPLLNGWTLFSHQKKAILRSLIMRRFILALDMGLGKTLIGCVWAKAFQQTFEGLKIIVVCPVSLKKEWMRTAQEATGLVVDDDDESTNVQIFGWSKTPSEVAPSIANYVVVFDEAHSLQSMQTQRTKAALKLVQSPKCVGVLMLSGTPMKNGKPLNLFPLLKAARHPFGDHQKAYETHFCSGHNKQIRGKVVWDANGASNLVQLRQHVSSHLLYMTKEECLDELPPKTREFRQVPVSSRHQLQHDSALNELAKAYHSTGSLEDSGDLVLTAVQRVRQIGSFAKIDATVGLAKDVLQEQASVVIFTSFVSVAKTVHKQLAEAGFQGELLTGETPPNKRQPMVDNFQAGLSPVFILTFGAGGVGITLTAAHTIILVDRPWTPGEAQQAEDRVRRIGQTKPVTSIWMVAFDLDKQIDSVLEQKTNTCSIVLKDGEEEAATAAPKISVFALLKTLMGNKSSARPKLSTTDGANSS